MSPHAGEQAGSLAGMHANVRAGGRPFSRWVELTSVCAGVQKRTLAFRPLGHCGMLVCTAGWGHLWLGVLSRAAVCLGATASLWRPMGSRRARRGDIGLRVGLARLYGTFRRV